MPAIFIICQTGNHREPSFFAFVKTLELLLGGNIVSLREDLEHATHHRISLLQLD